MKLEGQIFCVEEHEVSDIRESERCASCTRIGCDYGYDYFDTKDSDGNPLRLCMCCDQLWPSGEPNPEY